MALPVVFQDGFLILSKSKQQERWEFRWEGIQRIQGTSAIVRAEFATSLGNIITKFQVSFIPLDCSTLALVTSDQVLLCELVFSFIKGQVYSVYSIPWENRVTACCGLWE